MAGLYLFSYLCDGFDNWVVFRLLLRIDKETEDRRQKAIEEVIKLNAIKYWFVYRKDSRLLQDFKTQNPVIFQ